MITTRIAVVTGALSYTGSAIARSLLARGFTIRTLTNRTAAINDPGGSLEAYPLQFDDPSRLVEAMRGADVFVNTYWVRYPYVGIGFDRAVENTGVLFRAAREAGVGRVVHVSVSNPSIDSPLGYYRGKAEVEALLRGLGVSHAIVRPTLVVGAHDILVNNIAWFLRHFPLFAMPGSGRYRVQPVTLDDVGEIIAQAALATDNMTIDAAGPEVMTFEAFVREIARAIGQRLRIVHVPPPLSLVLLRAVGRLVGEVILSREELDGLMTELLVSHEPPRGVQSVVGWLREHGSELGLAYASEFARHVHTSRNK
ncbi:MAG TPA: NAD(P)H-binding protein [Dehalococcoidia bacterium]|nr:NAD(P)H-binding protein [Dehalococcoidia bacterium]